MERVLQQGPTNTNTPFFVEHQHFKVEESLVVENGGRGSASDCSYESFLLNTTEEEEKLRFLEEEEEEQQQQSVQRVQSLPFSLPSLEDKMPFLQMLQSVEAQSFSFTHQPYFQQLLSSIQHKHRWGERNFFNMEMELESCITHEICEASETKEEQHCNGESSNSAQEEKSCCKEENWVQFEYNEAPPPLPTAQTNDNYINSKSEERRKKRKRITRVSKKNKEEVETQRMTHITVERNRRKQMNDHLNVLRSLMPSSFVQRGDQASIIGGAIDFVKELEQHLQSLETQKRMRSSSSSSKSTQPQEEEEEEEEEEEFMRRKSFMRNRFFISPQYTTYSSLQLGEEDDDDEKEAINTQRSRMGMADIEVIIIQSHVNLKILTPRRQGQLLRAIAAFEDIRLTVLHLNVTTFDQSVLYSFNLKIEDGCEINTADDIAATVYQIFSFINTQQQQLDG